MNTDQIAAEAAARQWFANCHEPEEEKEDGIRKLTAIIQTAIEKATEATAEHFRQGLYAKLDEAMSRAAHASEQGAESFGLCLSHRAAYRLAKPDKCPICRLLEEMAQIESQRPTPATENTERVLKALARQPEPWERDLAATPATVSKPDFSTASEPTPIFDDSEQERDNVGEPEGEFGKPDSDSVGKQLSGRIHPLGHEKPQPVKCKPKHDSFQARKTTAKTVSAAAIANG